MGQSMADQTDPRKKLVNIFEEYARSKHNSLVWSSLCIMLASGVGWAIWNDGAVSDITLSWVAGGIRFPPWLVIGAFFLTATYMWRSWCWADSRLRLANTPLAFETAAADLPALFNTIEEAIVKCRSKITALQSEYDNLEPLRNRIERDLDGLLRVENGERIPGLGEIVEGMIKRIGYDRSRGLNNLDLAAQQLEWNAVEQLRDWVLQKLRDNPDVLSPNDWNCGEQLNRLSSEVEELNRFSEKLLGYYKNIDQGEINSRLWLDTRPVQILWVLALVVSFLAVVTSLCFPDASTVNTAPLVISNPLDAD